jgi:hypothetical protein
MSCANEGRPRFAVPSRNLFYQPERLICFSCATSHILAYIATVFGIDFFAPFWKHWEQSLLFLSFGDDQPLQFGMVNNYAYHVFKTSLQRSSGCSIKQSAFNSLFNFQYLDTTCSWSYLERRPCYDGVKDLNRHRRGRSIYFRGFKSTR